MLLTKSSTCLLPLALTMVLLHEPSLLKRTGIVLLDAIDMRASVLF
jgi:hypothetical protein